VRPHPNAHRIRLAQVDLGVGEPVQIVFGGPPIVRRGDLVPVAPPGSRLPGRDKMRRRSYRGESSYGMLCSLAELGWNLHAPDEVALLRNVAPGDSLDELMTMDWKSFVINKTELSDSNSIYGAQLLPSIAKDLIPQATQVISSTVANRPATPAGCLTPAD
jgi:tRNA-binding EMAP/Myf-like protein